MIQRGKSWSGNERNCCFLNTGSKRFATVSAVSGFDFLEDSRAVATVDWDFDGDLDLWTVNRTAPQVRFLRNDSPSDHHFVALRLEGTKCNRSAIGARVEVYLKELPGQKLIKTLRAGEGFLSQNSKWLYFGLGSAEKIQRIVARWPGGQAEEFTDLAADRHWLLVQGSGEGKVWQRPSGKVELASSVVEPPDSTDQARIWFSPRIPAPVLRYEDFDGRRYSVNDFSGPVLVNLWSSRCANCLKELREWKHNAAQLKQRNVQIVALAVDGLDTDSAAHQHASELIDNMSFPFASGAANPQLLDKLEILRGILFYNLQPFPVPTSFLIDEQGWLAAIYLGPVPLETLLADIGRLDVDADKRRALSVPFAGKWLSTPKRVGLMRIANRFRDRGYQEDAAMYDRHAAPERSLKICEDGTRFAEQGDVGRAVRYFREALRVDPKCSVAHCNLGVALHQQGKTDEAIPFLREAIKLDPDAVDAQYSLAVIHMAQEEFDEAIEHLGEALRVKPDDAEVRYGLVLALLERGEIKEAVQQLREVLEIEPGHLIATRQLSWILATTGDPSLRNADEAIALAEKVCQATDYKVPIVIDTLAVAYASAGRFDEAKVTARSALTLARLRKQSELAAQIKARLAKYEQGLRYNEPVLKR